MADYSKWTVNKIKEELTLRNASTRGRKENLIERLEAYDRNRNFENVETILPPPEITEWPTAGFKQLVMEHKVVLPKITRGQILGYFKYRQASDKQITGDLKSIEKGQLLLESRRVDACSINITRKDIFLTGIVGAAMKKKVAYNYKIKIAGQTGDVINSHCECPAGRGPHGTCKHVAAVLLVLEKFSESGDLMIGKSCTEDLQTFHKPRKNYQGSPIKAQNLPEESGYYLDDPRPYNTEILSDTMTL
ncbi:PREDICTED: uncharacterized protein LOC106810716 [Priapulus caudatus]|uniref:Uncharacterized protein LOC106810716 n=1 Tax=Priapulus caudatus TaxID=37621 RepID=A0ABM1EBR5_PRICU|nr:PREDICTED: uncharacterized protein LOC106810716 [Priapulus caudatus]